MAIITKTAALKVINGTSALPNQTTTGADTINISTGGLLALTDTIDGGLGIDTIQVGGTNTAAQTFNFGSSISNIEQILIDGAGNHNVNVAAVTAAIKITGNAGNNIITGTALADTITGGAGNDVINGGKGTDNLNGNEGNDIFVVSKGSDVTIAEVINGGTQLTNGTDQIRFSSTTANDTLTLGNNVTGIESIAIGTGTAAAAVTTGTLALNVNAGLVANALTITGNAGANRITATANNDTINGGAGNDTISAGAGSDIITGGVGADDLKGGAGDDTYIYTAATDFAVGESISDTDGYDTILHTGAGTLVLNANVVGIDQILIGATTSSTNAGGVNASAVNTSGGDGFFEIYGNAAANTLIGTVGDDGIEGGAGNDAIDAGAGNDFLDGGTGADTLKGGAGDDFIVGDASDSIDGGAGDDEFEIQANFTQANNVRLSGVEVIELANNNALVLNLTGQTEGFLIFDNDYNSNITGGAGNDTIAGGNGEDKFTGGAGNDTIFASSDDTQIDGGVGNDTLKISDDFTAISNATLVNIETIAININIDAGVGVEIDLSNQTEGFTVIGFNGADTITGGAGIDLIDADDGDDTIVIDSIASYAVGDVINGGDGDDFIMIDVTAADADATIQLVNVSNVESVSIEGNINLNLDASLVDTTDLDYFAIFGNNGANYIVGTAIDDDIYAGDGDDILDGGDGDDFLRGGAGSDLVLGGAGNDAAFFEGNRSDFQIVVTNGILTLTDSQNNVDTVIDVETFLFNDGFFSLDDILDDANTDISPDAEEIDGDNEVIGTEGNDFIALGAGDDTAAGEEGNDILEGEDGNDDLFGGAGDDTLSGGAGNDTVGGGDGADALIGDDGDDTLIGAGDSSVDDMTGGAGDDTYVINFNGAGDQVHEEEDGGTDTVTFDFFAYQLETNFENLILADGSAAVVGVGNALDNVITGNSDDNNLSGQAGNDTLNSGDGADTLNGGTGADVMNLDVEADESGNDQDHVVQDADHTGDQVIFTNTSVEGTSYDLTSADVVNDFHLNEDTFAFTFGLDEQGIVGNNDPLADNTYTLVYGTYDSETHGFNVNGDGNDTAVFYDADTDGGDLFTASIVFTGVQLTSANIGFDIT